MRTTSSASFSFVASDDKGFRVGTNSGSFALGNGESVTLPISVQPPATTPAFTQFTLSLSVNRQGTREAANSADITLLTQAFNQPSVCTNAAANVATLWPPEHQLADVGILGVSDPDGDPIGIVITGITQDEAVDAPGTGHTAPDGAGVGTSVASLRAERSGAGDGRVYAVGFTASDGRGGSCAGQVRVDVPKNQAAKAVDSGQSFDSTAIPSGF